MQKFDIYGMLPAWTVSWQRRATLQRRNVHLLTDSHMYAIVANTLCTTTSKSCGNSWVSLNVFGVY